MAPSDKRHIVRWAVLAACIVVLLAVDGVDLWLLHRSFESRAAAIAVAQEAIEVAKQWRARALAAEHWREICERSVQTQAAWRGDGPRVCVEQ